jgi:succinate-semialdehyde dehydrogenase/glutarate-semialdehyde dehydrogenase
MYIGGEWRPSFDGKRIPVVDPASEKVIAKLARGSAGDTGSAVDAAFQARPGWASTAPRDRDELLRKALELITARNAEFATMANSITKNWNVK